MFQRLPNKLKLMISTCKCYPTRDRSPRLDCASPPFSTKSSALPAHPVIENSCSKPSGFVNFQVSTQSFPYNGRFDLLIDLVVSTGGNVENGLTTVGRFTLCYTYKFFFLGGIHVKVKN